MVQVVRAKALFDCVGDEESELTFREGDLLVDVRETSEDGWLQGRLERTGEEGLFPNNYVELIYVDVEPSKPALAPQLPARSSSVATKSTSSPSAAPLQLDITPRQPTNATSTKPQLPARKDQTSAALGLQNLGTASGFGSRTLSGVQKSAVTALTDSITDSNRSPSGPPALPKRTSTIGDTGNDQTSTTEPPLSVRERMANLSMAGQRQVKSALITTTGMPPVSLPPRPSGRESTQGNSSLSTPLRPALPPRATPESKSETPSSSGSSERTYQVQDAAVPVPKLTTFSRPRSVATSKSAGSSPKKRSPSTLSTISQLEPASTPPKLPSRTPSMPASVSSLGSGSATDKSMDTSASSGPVRFSPAAIRQVPSQPGILPTISRNPQPLALPSRTNTNSPHALPAGNSPQGLRDGTSQDEPSGPLGSAFGVKLNSVGLKMVQEAAGLGSSDATNDDSPPPLPARSSTMPVNPPARADGPVAQLMRSQREPNPPFSPPSSTGILERSWKTRSLMVKPVSESPVHEPVRVKLDARRRYEELFRSICSRDYIEGPKVHEIYVRSRLDSKTLAQIWDLVDVDRAGRLSQAQFCMGMYLIDERLASGVIPLQVSDELWASVH
ncbi:hypothetical protein B0O80DRAFT_49769 [Mortierella sp. GBAus27b]|nr:Increased rDNA silencing protein [Mortierella sp. GBA43]KAI8354928.1 hypothetical protein B0O80DRAFT_49769 [Mortierella sp. GBAus27b]